MRTRFSPGVQSQAETVLAARGVLCERVRALIQADIYDEFMARCLERIASIRQGNPLDTDTQLGPQVSAQQMQKIASYVDIGRDEGAEVLIGGQRASVDGPEFDAHRVNFDVLVQRNAMYREAERKSMAAFQNEIEAKRDSVRQELCALSGGGR